MQVVLLIMNLCHKPRSCCLCPTKHSPCIPAPKMFLLRRCRLLMRVCRQLWICLSDTLRACVFCSVFTYVAVPSNVMSPTELDTVWTHKFWFQMCLTCNSITSHVFTERWETWSRSQGKSIAKLWTEPRFESQVSSLPQLPCFLQVKKRSLGKTAYF